MNERQTKIDTLKKFFLGNSVEDPQNGTVFDCDVIDTLDSLIRQYADSPAKGYHRTPEEKELGFYPVGTTTRKIRTEKSKNQWN